MGSVIRRHARCAAALLWVCPFACGTTADPGIGLYGAPPSGSSGGGGGSSGAGSGGGGATLSASSSGGAAAGSSGGGGPGSGSGSSGGALADAGGDGGVAGDAGITAGGEGGAAGPWAGLRVVGTGFVDGTGAEFIPRGLGIGEWHNIESYMIDIQENSDSPGMGETELRNALAKAMGDAGAAAFFALWEANIVTASDVQLWASWGVNSIRLPINYHAISTADGAYIESGFQVIDQFVGWCKANGIYVILDLHAAPGSQNCEEMSDTPDGVAHLWTQAADYRQWTIDLWQTIAKRYAGETGVGGYDLFDEPYDVESSGSFSTATGGTATLKQMYLDLTAAIRAVDPNHVLFFEGTNWSSADGTTSGDGFAGLTPAWDPQMAYAFHKYWDDNTTAAIQPYLDLRTTANRPVWNGETGENTYAWNTAMIALLEANKIGWNMWTYKKNDAPSDYAGPNGGSGTDRTQAYGIVEPPNYSTMTAYLLGGAMPSQSDANTIMMAFAANAATSKCVYNADYVKSVFNK